MGLLQISPGAAAVGYSRGNFNGSPALADVLLGNVPAVSGSSLIHWRRMERRGEAFVMCSRVFGRVWRYVPIGGGTALAFIMAVTAAVADLLRHGRTSGRRARQRCRGRPY